MINFFEAVLRDKRIKKFEVDNLLFAEYKCPEGDDKIDIWSQNNYFDFILDGKMIWKTPRKEYYIKAGDAFFVKKGGYITHHFYDEQFCDIIIFVPDDFIKNVVDKYKIKLSSEKKSRKSDTIIPLNFDETLKTYLQSLIPYFDHENPPHYLLKLKFEELLINILSGSNNSLVKDYCREVCLSNKIPIKEIMEANFTSGLTINEFACLCARSPSTFKRDFNAAFNTSPGKWLIEKKIEYGKFLLETTGKSIEDITFDAGFKNRSHFIKVFKDKYGTTPLKFKKTKSLSETKQNLNLTSRDSFLSF
ncbi:MAG: helix-turn-helix domain-containing protein [Ignavibacteria bacterium]